MGAAAPKPPHAIHPHSKLWGILAFSHERSTTGNPSIAPQGSQPGEQQAGKRRSYPFAPAQAPPRFPFPPRLSARGLWLQVVIHEPEIEKAS